MFFVEGKVVTLNKIQQEVMRNISTNICMDISKLTNMSRITKHECRIGSCIRGLIDKGLLHTYTTKTGKEILKLNSR